MNTSSALAWVTPNTKSIRRAVHNDYPGQLLLRVEKRAPDYLPIPEKYLHKKYVRSYAYQYQIIGHSKEFKHTVLPGGRLQLTWRANHAGPVRLPIVTYQESRLVVNGHQLHHYPRSCVGAPTVDQRKGRNTAVLSFHQAGWFTVLLVVSLTGLTALSFYGLYKLIRWVPQKYQEIINQ